jgi:hypothetical protein
MTCIVPEGVLIRVGSRISCRRSPLGVNRPDFHFSFDLLEETLAIHCIPRSHELLEDPERV